MAQERLVIANTTPLINFAEIDRVGLLRDLFGEVIVPQAVVDELQAKSELFPRAAVAWKAPFCHLRNPVNRVQVATLTRELHAGESECIALALESPSSLLLLDEIAAREVAEHHGLRFTGTLGCVRLARQLGLLDAVAPVLDALRTEARFWIGPELVDQVLRDAGEWPTP